MLKTFVLFFLSFSALAGEVVYKESAPQVWHAYDENGIELDQAGSICQGLDTAINYSVANSHQLRVLGGGASTYEPTVNCSATLHIPPIEKAHIDLGAITLNFPPPVSGDGVVFDSCLNSFVRMDGQITYFGTRRALVFRPTQLLPLDTVAGVTFANCEIRINTAFGAGEQVSVVDFDTTNGSIIGNLFNFDEIHASALYSGGGCVGGWHNMRVLESQPRHGFIANRVNSKHTHGACNVAIFVGANGATSTIHDNIFEMNIYPWSGGYGILTNGSNDEYHASVLDNEGQVSGGIILGSGASNNRFYNRSIIGGTINNSGNQTNRFY